MTFYFDKPIVIEAAEEIKSYIEKAWGAHISYRNAIAKADEDFKNQIIGSVGREELRRELTDNRKNTITTAYEAMKYKLDSFRSKELDKIKQDRTPISQDDVAELMLLAEVEVSQEELEEYVQRYKHSTLALRKLRDIAKANKLNIGDIPLDREESVNKLFKQFEESVSYWANTNPGQMDMLAMEFTAQDAGKQELEWAQRYNREYKGIKSVEE